jgi:membrane protein YqaA with SNARE-associated domain
VVVLAARHDGIFWVFPPLVTMASLVGAVLTYWVGRTAGFAGLPRFMPAHHLERMKSRLDTAGSGTLAAAALLPPPFPLTAFLLTCGALDFDRRRFLFVFGIMRLVRFGAVAVLARHYGDVVLQMLDAESLQRVVTAIALVALAAAIVTAAAAWSRMRPQPA